MFALGIGTAVSAVLGPLVLGVVEFRVSESAESQLIGGEIVSLLVVSPLAVAAGMLWLRGHILAPILAFGPAIYAFYLNLQLILGPEYLRYDGNNERFFPLYLTLVVLGWMVTIAAGSRLMSSAPPLPTGGLRPTIAIVLIVVGLFFAFAWVTSIIEVAVGDTMPEGYEDDPTLFWLVRLMDLAFIIPVAVITGVGLLLRSKRVSVIAYAIMAFLTLEVGAVAGMAISMMIRDDPAADAGLLIVTGVSTVVLAILWVLLLRHALAASRSVSTPG